MDLFKAEKNFQPFNHNHNLLITGRSLWQERIWNGKNIFKITVEKFSKQTLKI